MGSEVTNTKYPANMLPRLTPGPSSLYPVNPRLIYAKLSNDRQYAPSRRPMETGVRPDHNHGDVNQHLFHEYIPLILFCMPLGIFLAIFLAVLMF